MYKCDKSFKAEKDLALHSSNCHDNKEFKCTKCKAFFNNNNDINEHNRNVHMVVRIDCWTCGNTFHSKQSLTTHIQSEHRHKRRYLYDNSENRYEWQYNDTNMWQGIYLSKS